MLKAAAVVIGLAVLTIAMTWPLLSPSAAVLPDSDDAYFSVWRVAWVAHQLPRDPSQLFNANIFHPTPGTLALSDAMLLVSILGAPAIWLGASPAIVHNWLLGAAILSSAVFAFLLVRALTRSLTAAWVASVIFAFAPYRIAHLGHLELQWVMWMPLSLWLLHRLMSVPSPRAALSLGVAITAQLFCSIYYGVFLSIYLGVAAIVMLVLWAPSPRRVIAVSPLIMAPVLFVVAIYGPAYAQTRERLGARDVSEITEYSAVPADYLRVPLNNRLRGSTDPGPAPDERTLFPGTVAIAAAAAAFVPPVAPATWMYAGLVAFSVDASLGMNGFLFPLLHRIAPPLTSLRAPARFGVLVLLSVAVLAGYGIAKITSRWPQVALTIGCVATLGCVLEYWSAPVSTRPNQEPPTPAHQWLAQQPAGIVVVELPMPETDSLWLYETTYVMRSTHHWQRLINGYSGFAPAEYQRSLTELRGFPDQTSIDRLRALNARYVLLNQEYYTPEDFTALIDRVSQSPWLIPPQSFGPEGRRIVVVELKPSS